MAGTVITNGQAIDTNGNIWLLPTSVTIPSGGSVNVTVTAQNAGAISAGAGTINGINTPTYGWQSITNTSAATPGAPVEQDGALRQRQSASVGAPAQTVVDAIYGAISNVSGVTLVDVYENDTTTTDANGVPAHCIAPIVAGGSLTDIATAIMLRKSPGGVTYGTTSVTVNDQNGYPTTVNFFVLSYIQIYVDLTIQPLTGYVSTTGQTILNAILQYINDGGVGALVEYFGVAGPAGLSGDAATASSGLTQAQLDALKSTYKVTALTIGTSPAPTGTTDVAIPFNQAPQTSLANLSLTVL
ncbi:MAG: hypothetical protein B7X10_00810 [Burkholderiales bacterium 21-58-4]|nr:MAG: hypothetical protein B7X10_00810 [Burkholderiales bacterium 21-58-4]